MIFRLLLIVHGLPSFSAHSSLSGYYGTSAALRCPRGGGRAGCPTTCVQLQRHEGATSDMLSPLTGSETTARRRMNWRSMSAARSAWISGSSFIHSVRPLSMGTWPTWQLDIEFVWSSLGERSRSTLTSRRLLSAEKVAAFQWQSTRCASRRAVGVSAAGCGTGRHTFIPTASWSFRQHVVRCSPDTGRASSPMA